LEKHSPDIAVFTETWANNKLPRLHEAYTALSTPHAPYQGVAILVKSKFRTIPLDANNWSPFLMCCKVYTTSKHFLIIIGAYLQPQSHALRLSELKSLIRRTQTSFPTAGVVVIGDLNMPIDNATVEATSLGLKCFTFAPGTRLQNDTWSTLDYFWSTL